ncbi:MAG: glycosyltransferase, partial [Prolixibacteraceae bacterium]|nr:glycosyltransferase [Prolixibacteraceae bacterium]
KYAISVSRAQTDNNLHVLLKAFEDFDDYKLVLVSNWEVSVYGKALKEKYKGHPNMVLLDAIYNQDELNYLRSNAYVYIHSHSRCGTAPSLVEAMCLNIPVISYDVETNRETTENNAIYFSGNESLVKILKSLTDDDLKINKAKLFALATEKYSWNTISSEYKKLFDN